MNFQQFRQSRGLTLEAVGYLTGLDKSTVSRVERGRVQPQPETVVRLARALGLSVASLRAMLASGSDAQRGSSDAA